MKKLLTVFLTALMLMSTLIVGNATTPTQVKPVVPVEKEQNGITIDTHAIKSNYWDFGIDLSFDWVLLDSTGTKELYRKNINKNSVSLENRFIKMNAAVKPNTNYKIKFENVKGADLKVELFTWGKTWAADGVFYELKSGQMADIYTIPLDSDLGAGKSYYGSREFPVQTTYTTFPTSTIVRVEAVKSTNGKMNFITEPITLINTETNEKVVLKLNEKGQGHFVLPYRNYDQQPITFRLGELPKGLYKVKTEKFNLTQRGNGADIKFPLLLSTKPTN